MRALHLDFQARKPRSWASLLLLAVAVAAVAAALWQFGRLQTQGDRWDAELARAQARLHKGEQAHPAAGQGARFAEESAAANAVIEQLQFPWAALFGAFEGAAGEDVALIGIEPDPAKGLVTITAEAKAPKDMLNYVRRLERTSFLEDVLLRKHETRTDDPDKPLRFTVVATWKSRE